MRSKVMNDNIHGTVPLHELLVRIIDRPAFQRLRNISQLGVTSWVYPNANHHRFEHSIGTAHLAGKLVRHLREFQPELGLSDRDVLVAQVAGLLHDVGHGPFSHTWDGRFLPMALGKKFKHEELSLQIIDLMLAEDGGELRRAFATHGLDDDSIQLVKEMISGGAVDGQALIHEGSPKSFLYEVISNQRTGLDVDKLDYLARDTHGLGISLVSLTCDIDRLISFTRVHPWAGGHRLAFRDKEVPTLMNFFHLRQRLHRVAYQHKTSVAIEMMLVEALLAADAERRLAERVYDVHQFVRLTDHIFWDLLYSSEPGLAESRRILGAIIRRDLYRPLLAVSLAEAPPGEAAIRAAVLGELKGAHPSLAADCGRAVRIAVCAFSFSSAAELVHQLVVFNKQGQAVRWDADSAGQCGEGPGRPLDQRSPREWEVRLYSATAGPIPGLDQLRRAAPGVTCSTNEALAWAFCRWAGGCSKKGVQLVT